MSVSPSVTPFQSYEQIERKQKESQKSFVLLIYPTFRYIYVQEHKKWGWSESEKSLALSDSFELRYDQNENISLSQLLFNFLADQCYDYHNLSDADRKSSYVTPTSGPVFCDDTLLDGWYRFVGDAGTKMPTTRVPAFRCGTDWSGWLNGAHPTVGDGKVIRKVCFSNRDTGCRSMTYIFVTNCGSFYIYKPSQPPVCDSRYCGTD